MSPDPGAGAGGAGGAGSAGGGLGSGGVVGSGVVGPGPALGSGGGGLGSILGAHGLTAVGLGGLSGIVAMGGLIAAGIVQVHPRSPVAPDPNLLALVTCPGSGAVITNAKPGDRMLLTGRSPDGSWVQVYIPGPVSHGWAPKSLLTIDGDPATLPEVDCGQVALISPSPEITATPSVEPSESASPSATPTPTQSPKPTPRPNSGPQLAALTASTAVIRYPVVSPGYSCTLGPTSVHVSVSATDSDGVASVVLWYRKPGASTYRHRTMSKGTGSSYSASISVTSDGLTKSGSLTWYVVATDADAQPRETRSADRMVAIKRCNRPPVFSDFGFSGINVQIVGGPACGKTSVSVAVYIVDPENDKVTSVRFFYKPYGSSSTYSFNLIPDYTHGPGGSPWTHELTNTRFPKIPANMPNGVPWTWHVRMTDSRGNTADSPTITLTEQPC
jgi:hypothetical protein